MESKPKPKSSDKYLKFSFLFAEGIVGVQSIGSLWTSADFPFGAGVQYCHLLSPAKALEYMAIDVHKPQDSQKS